MKKIQQVKPLHCTSIDGRRVTIGKGSPQPTFLLFFSTLCADCGAAVPAISQQLEQFRDQLQVVAVGRDHDKQELEEWAKGQDLIYSFVADAERQLFSYFADIHVPRIYLIDVLGEVKYQDVHWHPFMLEPIQEAVQKLF